MSSRRRKAKALASDDYHDLMLTTVEASKAMRLLQTKEDNDQYDRCKVCQEWSHRLEYHCPITHETHEEGLSAAERETELQRRKEELANGTIEPRPLDKVSVQLKVTKALTLDIEAAMPMSAVKSNAMGDWRDDWIEKVKSVLGIEEMRECAEELLDHIKPTRLRSNFFPTVWLQELRTATAKDLYKLMLRLDGAILFEKQLSREQLQAEEEYSQPSSRPQRKMARPELAVKWGYTPGHHFDDRKAGITGKALHVQDGRLVLEITKPAKMKGKVKRYTMSQAKAYLTEVDRPKKRKEPLIKICRKRLRAYSVLTGSSTEDWSPEDASDIEGTGPPVPACKSLLDDMQQAVAIQLPGDQSEGTAREISERICEFRAMLRSATSRDDLVRCLLHLEKTVFGEGGLDGRWGKGLRAAADVPKCLPYILELDRRIEYTTLFADLQGGETDGRDDTKGGIGKAAAKSTSNAQKLGFDPRKKYTDMRTGKLAVVLHEQDKRIVVSLEGATRWLGADDAQEILERSDGEPHVSTEVSKEGHVSKNWTPGSPDSNDEELRMVAKLMSTLGKQCMARSLVSKPTMSSDFVTGELWGDDKYLIVVRCLLTDMFRALPEAALQSKRAKNELDLPQRLKRTNSVRSVAACAVDLEQKISRDYVHSWHQSEPWQKECRGVRSAQRLADLILRLDSAIIYTGDAMDIEEEVERPPRKAKRRPNRPDLAIKWGYTPNKNYYDVKLRQTGQCLYVQAGNLVVEFGGKIKRYSMDMARRCLRLAKKEEEEQEEEEDEGPAESTSSKKPSGKIVARPVDGDRFRYSEEAQYVSSVRAWAINWIEYVPTGLVVRTFHKVTLIRGSTSEEYGVWMLVRTGEGRAGRNLVHLLDLQSQKVGSADVSSIHECLGRCSSSEVSAMKDWQSKFKRRPFALVKIKPSGTRSRGRPEAAKRLLRPTLDSKRPLRRSRRQEAANGIERVPRPYELEIVNLRARIMDLETHNMQLVDHVHELESRLARSGIDPKVSLQETAKRRRSMGDEAGKLLLPSHGGGELPIPDTAPTDAVQRVMKYDVGILAKITSFLDVKDRAKACCVSHLWNTPIINKEITIIDFANMKRNCITDQVITGIACRHTEVDSLCLEHCKSITDEAIWALAEYYDKDLIYLNICYCTHLTDKAVTALERCKKLKTLLVVGCPDISNNALKNLTQTLRKLEVWPKQIKG